MSKNITLTLSYDGTSFFGWQKTKEGASIEEHLEKALEQILQHPITLQAASRTDRGVHAEGQVVNFFTSRDHNRLLMSLNSLLPKEIRINKLMEQPSHFHPTLDARGKEYHYRLSCGPVQNPHDRMTAWHVPQSLDFCKMQEAAGELEGTHDFSAFCTKVTYRDSIRTLERVRLFEEEGGGVTIVMRGDNFLYKMARTIVGTLVLVGRGKLDRVDEILSSRKRVEAGVTAPAHGLCLKRVLY